MTGRRLAVLIALLAALVVAGLLLTRPPSQPSGQSPTPSTQPSTPNPQHPPTTPPPPPPLGIPALDPLPPPTPSDPALRSPLADKLPSPADPSTHSTPPGDDIRIVLSLFKSFYELNGGMPVGTNEEIVNALTGNNPRRLAILPRDHPAIDVHGELIDRWGTPFFFHNIARDNIEIRSAGPDREMYSTDDLVAGSMAPQPP